MNRCPKTLRILLAWVILLNPIIASGSAFISFQEISTPVKTFEVSVSMPCHVESHIENHEAKHEQRYLPNSEQNQAHESQFMAHDTSSACLSDPCQCSDSACNTVSIVYQAKLFAFNPLVQLYDFHLPLYLSLSATPSSPPPII